MRHMLTLAKTLVAIVVLANLAVADVPNVMSYQGRLTDSGGEPLDTTVSMTFAIYDDSTGGTLQWSEGKTVSVNAGLFTVRLGSTTPLDVAYLSGADRWLELTVEGETIEPRARLTTSPFSFRVSTIDGATGGTVQGPLTLGTPVGKDDTNERGPSYIDMDEEGAAGDGARIIITDGAGTETIKLLGSEIVGSGPGGAVKLYDQYGIQTVKIDGERPSGGGALSLHNSSETRTIQLSSEVNGLGANMFMKRLDGSMGIEIDAEDDRAGWGSRLTMWDDDGDTAATIEAATNYDNNTPQGGKIRLFDDNGTNTLQLYAESYYGTGGYVALKNTGGNTKINMAAGAAGEMKLYNSSGESTIELRAETSGSGRIITEVIEITGGSDLSEQFDVCIDEGSQGPLPGMVVCIDPANPGRLKQSTEAYDATVAGIISGAGDVTPGMLMGHQGTIADGKYPVALTGRVYCLADASYGSIQPGDMLTTSNTPGHAMKATDRDRAYGAVIGKAMTGLDEGRGLILVLVNLQ